MLFSSADDDEFSFDSLVGNSKKEKEQDEIKKKAEEEAAAKKKAEEEAASKNKADEVAKKTLLQVTLEAALEAARSSEGAPLNRCKVMVVGEGGSVNTICRYPFILTIHRRANFMISLFFCSISPS